MRPKQQMLDIILSTAQFDDRIRGVILNGSRANSNVIPDIFQDFDIVYIVSDVTPFRNNLAWIERFGNIMIMQMPTQIEMPGKRKEEGLTYLMQFVDGNRIDLRVVSKNNLADLQDSLSKILVDKDNQLGHLAAANEEDYLPLPPSPEDFTNSCNEFWWVSTYVAKGLWREEILYAKHLKNQILRKELNRMMTWQIGIGTKFTKNLGIYGKYFKRFLTAENWELLQKTYADADYQNTWDALFDMGTLFRKSAEIVATHFGFVYNLDEDEKVSAHLKHVRKLPIHAKEIY